MKAYLSTLILIFTAFQISAQRYLTEQFTDVDVTSNVLYSQNITGITGVPTLDIFYADYYTPNGNTETSRPLVVVISTGSLVCPLLCENLVILHKDEEQKVQKIETVLQTLAVREKYSYSIEFLYEKNKITANVYSKGGVKFNQGDEIIFMDTSDIRKVFKFFQIGRKLTKDGASVFGNAIQLDLEEVKWLANASIKTIYIKNNKTDELRKFIVNSSRQAAFGYLTACFYNALDKPEKWGNIENPTNPPQNVIGSTPSSDEKVYQVVEDMPRFPGCENEPKDKRDGCANKKMLEFIYENLEYPSDAGKNGIEGTVVIQFVIDEKGAITKPKIVKDIAGQCGQEGLRIVKLMNSMDEKWIPGKQRGKLVKVRYTLPIKFSLD